jgi:N-acetylglucosamine-6-phosphate deacetylase
MNRILISGPVALAEGDSLSIGQVADAAIYIEDGFITRVAPGLEPGADVLVSEGVIAPGFLELQINGAYGADFTTDASSIVDASARLPASGVTAFLPTIITSPFDDYPPRLAEARQAAREARGAEVLGLHLEGPYLSPRRPGAHDPSLLRPIDVDEILAWAAPDIVRIVTLAPELPGAAAAIRALRARGILVSVGHSNASYQEALVAFDAGIAWGTHLYNAMSPLGHREPGLMGALLVSPVPVGLIADGVHSHPAMVKVAYRCKGADGIAIVTDAMEAMGMAPGTYRLADRIVDVDGKTARLADGTLAGSILTMDAGVRNMVEFTGCPQVEALAMASSTPARILRTARNGNPPVRKGRITAGNDADLVILDNAGRVVETWVRGERVYGGA